MLAASPLAMANPAASSAAELMRFPDESCANDLLNADCERDRLNIDEEPNPVVLLKERAISQLTTLLHRRYTLHPLH